MQDFLDLLKALNSEKVQFVVIGGLAMVIYGASTITQDLDIAIALDADNGDAFIRALAPFEPFPPQFGTAQSFVWDSRSLVGSVMTLITTVGKVDVLRVLPGVDSFDGLYARSEIKSLRGENLRIASIDDLIRMKQVANRPKDLIHISQLQDLKNLLNPEN